jgi:DNA-binding transcriptional LysR family regulator
MLIRQLEYAVALAREGHFGRAAASCWVSQPALSDAISSLEAELGVLIARRGRRYQGLTPEGELLVAWARRLLTERDELLSELTGGTQALSGKLRLGAIPTALPLVPLVTEALRRIHPGLGFTVRSLPGDEIMRRLATYELDAGLTYLGADPLPGEVRCLPLYEERYVLMTPSEGPLGERDEVTWAEAAKLPLCLLSPEMQNRRILDSRFRQDGVSAVPAVETDSLSVLNGHLRTGQWSSIVPQSWLRLLDRPAGTRLVRLAPPAVSATVGLVALAREPVPAVLRALLDVVANLDMRNAVGGERVEAL